MEEKVKSIETEINLTENQLQGSVKPALIVLITFLCLISSSFIYAQNSTLENAIPGYGNPNHASQDTSYQNKLENRRANTSAYKYGNQIVNGIAQNIAEGIKRTIDPNLTFSLTKSNNEMLYNGNSYPIVESTMRIRSVKLENPKITFRLILEVDKHSGTVVGTIYNLMMDGKRKSRLEFMNGYSYIQDKYETIQVRITNGTLQRVNPNDDENSGVDD